MAGYKVPEGRLHRAQQGELNARDVAWVDSVLSVYMDEGWAHEEAILLADARVAPDLSGVEDATLFRNADGEWACVLTDADGESYTIQLGEIDGEFPEWLWRALIDEGIEISKDIDSP